MYCNVYFILKYARLFESASSASIFLTSPTVIVHLMRLDLLLTTIIAEDIPIGVSVSSIGHHQVVRAAFDLGPSYFKAHFILEVFLLVLLN